MFKELRKEFGKVRINRQKNVVNIKHVENLVAACQQIQSQFEAVVDFQQIKSSLQTQQTDRSSQPEGYQQEDQRSVMDSLSSTLKNMKDRITDGVKQITHDLIGTPSSALKPVVYDLFSEMVFVGEWIQELLSQKQEGVLL